MDPEKFFNALKFAFLKRGQIVEDKGDVVILKKGYMTLSPDGTVTVATDNALISIRPHVIPDDADIVYLRRAIYKILLYTQGIAKRKVTWE